MSTKDTLYDRRIAARNLKHGRISRKEFDQYLASLPDASGKAVSMFSGGEPRRPAAVVEAGPDLDDLDEEDEDDVEGEEGDGGL